MRQHYLLTEHFAAWARDQYNSSVAEPAQIKREVVVGSIGVTGVPGVLDLTLCDAKSKKTLARTAMETTPYVEAHGEWREEPSDVDANFETEDMAPGL